MSHHMIYAGGRPSMGGLKFTTTSLCQHLLKNFSEAAAAFESGKIFCYNQRVYKNLFGGVVDDER